MTQKSLEHRGLPETFYVFRGGEVYDNDKPMPTSLSPATAADNIFSQKVGEPYVAMYEVNRDDVLLDMNSMKPGAQQEEELIILGRHLKNQRMVRLPNRMIKNPEFHKSKPNEAKEAEAVEINLSKLLVLESALEHLAKATLKGEHPERDSEEFVFQKSMKNVVKVGNVDIPVEIALDPVRGLSGRGSMNPGTGMLFRMVNARDFWMKDMRFPLDIIWINDKREVVDISENLPIPTAASHFLPLYSPKRLAVYALEINGGEAKALGINIGDAVEINVS